MKLNKFLLASILMITTSSFAHAEDIIQSLNSYGEKISSTSEEGNIIFIKAYQTVSKPLNSYRLDFNTTAKELLSVPNADIDATANYTNLAITKVWEAKFCSDEIIAIMNNNHVDMVSGFLNNNNEPQHVAICFKDSNKNQSSINKDSSQETILGSWYDDVGSPEYMDCTFTIFKNKKGLFLKRANGDGSSGTYPLKKEHGKYIKINDKFGAYYIIKDNNLDIYDKEGFIRSAKQK